MSNTKFKNSICALGSKLSSGGQKALNGQENLRSKNRLRPRHHPERRHCRLSKRAALTPSLLWSTFKDSAFHLNSTHY